MSLLRKSPAHREAIADDIADRLDRPMAALGIIFLLVVVGEGLAESGSGLSTALTITGWGLWGLFVAEFLARLTIAPSRTRFLRKNWWQILLLALPFLRFLRVVRLLRVARFGRVARAGRVVSSGIRATRSARATLTARVGWLVAATSIVILTSSQLLYEFGGPGSYATALHDAAYAAIAAQPIGDDSPFARVLEIVLAAFSVAVFAALAGTIGTYFLDRSKEAAGPDPLDPGS